MIYVQILATDTRRFQAACSTRRKADKWLERTTRLLDGTGNIVTAWAMHDGSGWCEGSPNSWKFIDTVGEPHVTTEIIF